MKTIFEMTCYNKKRAKKRHWINDCEVGCVDYEIESGIEGNSLAEIFIEGKIIIRSLIGNIGEISISLFSDYIIKEISLPYSKLFRFSFLLSTNYPRPIKHKKVLYIILSYV